VGFWDIFRKSARPAEVDCDLFASGTIESASEDGKSAVLRLTDGGSLTFDPSRFALRFADGDAALAHVAVRGGSKRVVEVRRPPERRAGDALFLRPLASCSSWALACGLVRGDGEPRFAAAVAETEAELRSRGKTPDDIDAMRRLVRWAISTLNPPGAEVHDVVGDHDDLDRAIASATEAGAPPRELADRRAFVDRHRDGASA